MSLSFPMIYLFSTLIFFLKFTSCLLSLSFSISLLLSLSLTHTLYIVCHYSKIDPYVKMAAKDSMGEDGQRACVVAATLAERICSG